MLAIPLYPDTMSFSRKLLFLTAAACFAFIGIALYLQLALDLLPCPLCVIQRYCFLLIGFASLFGACFSKVRGAVLVSAIGALGGLITVGKHLWVLAHPGFKCGIDPAETFLNRLPTAEYLPTLFEANGICEAATDTILGLSVPQWSCAAFVIVTLALILAWRRR